MNMHCMFIVLVRCIHVLSYLCYMLIPRGCLWCQAGLVEAVGQVSVAYHIPLLSSVMQLNLWNTFTLNSINHMHNVLIIALLAGLVVRSLVDVHSHSTASFVLPHWYMFIIHCCYNTMGRACIVDTRPRLVIVTSNYSSPTWWRLLVNSGIP